MATATTESTLTALLNGSKSAVSRDGERELQIGTGLGCFTNRYIASTKILQFDPNERSIWTREDEMLGGSFGCGGVEVGVAVGQCFACCVVVRPVDGCGPTLGVVEYRDE
jgi:hypothetical protein